MPQTQTMMDDINQTLQDAYARMMHALWKVMTTGQAEWVDAYAANEIAYQNLIVSPAIADQIARLQKVSSADPLLARQLQLLQHERLDYPEDPAQRELMTKRWNELHQVISSYRTRMDGASFTASQVHTLLRTLTDESRREQLWRQSMQVGKLVAPGLVELVKMRNQMANEKGFSNYYELKLYAQEISPHDIDLQIVQLRKALDRSYRKAKDQIDWEVASLFRISPNAIRPWHYTDPNIPGSSRFECKMQWSLSAFLPRLSSWLRKKRIAIDDVLRQADWAERPGKSQANCCLNIDRGNDIRILCNANPVRSGLRIVLHEIGHAVYESRLNPALPFLLRQPAHIFLSEAIALLFERLKDEKDWCREMGLQFRSEPSDKENARMKRLVRLYWTIAVVQFERELYRNPDGPLGDIWWSQMENVMGVQRPDQEDDPYWAAVPHLTTLPVYYYNYLLGEIASSQIRHMLDLQCGGWHSEEGFDRLKETVFRAGASQPWNVVLNNCTTCELNAIFIAEELTADKGVSENGQNSLKQANDNSSLQ